MRKLAGLVRMFHIYSKMVELAGELFMKIQALVLLHTSIIHVELTQFKYLWHIKIM